MTASAKAVEFITEEEGVVLRPYLDASGIPTIGVGSTMYETGKRVKIGDPNISLAYAKQLLYLEIAYKTTAINGLLKGYVVNQNQMDALISLVYNIGVGAFEKSTVLRLIKKNPCDPNIETAWLLWNKITKNGKKVLNKGLLARRKREYALYNSNTL